MDSIELVYDGNCQCIIARVPTSIGPQMHNVCSYCRTRFHGDSCHRYSWCVAAKDRPGAPWSLPWTSFTDKPKVYERTDPVGNYDPITHFLKGDYR